MGRVKGLHPGSSKDMVQCPVDGCIKVKVRRDNWIKHIHTYIHEGLAGDLRVLPSGGFQLSQAKKNQNEQGKLFTHMKEWAQEHGKSVRQRSARQETTKKKAGTLPLSTNP